MKKNKSFPLSYIVLALPIFLIWGCVPKTVVRSERKTIPASYNSGVQDTTSIGKINWRNYFNDPVLIALIDTALANNQEMNIIRQEMEIAKNEVKAKKGEYLPFVGLMGGAEKLKDGAYTFNEAVKDNLSPTLKKDVLESNNLYTVGATASWEVDIWKKLRNAKDAAVLRYLSSVEGKNLAQTNLIAEIASSYYELMAQNNLLDIIDNNIKIQSDALKVVRLQKESAKVTQLAVNRFEAQLLHTQNLRFDIRQQIVETENKINFLTGRYPKPIVVNSQNFITIPFDSIQTGIPAQLLANRPDIRKAELELAASKLDVKVAKANFYPTLDIRAGLGLRAFNPKFLIDPTSLLVTAAGELAAPLINRNAIVASYNTANARQMQSVYTYEQTILNAYLEVQNELSKLQNYNMSFDTKNEEVTTLLKSVTIANQLFNSARADYGEVLLTQREALDARMELVEIKMELLHSKVNIYRELGGGWK